MFGAKIHLHFFEDAVQTTWGLEGDVGATILTFKLVPRFRLARKKFGHATGMKTVKGRPFI